MEKCKICGAKYAKFPYKDKDGKILWLNLFKMDFMSIMFLVVVIFLLFAYQHDTQVCREERENPCKVCIDSNCCEVIESGRYEQQNKFDIQYDVGIK